MTKIVVEIVFVLTNGSKNSFWLTVLGRDSAFEWCGGFSRRSAALQMWHDGGMAVQVEEDIVRFRVCPFHELYPGPGCHARSKVVGVGETARAETVQGLCTVFKRA